MIYAVSRGSNSQHRLRLAIANSMILCIAVFSAAFILLVRGADKRANDL